MKIQILVDNRYRDLLTAYLIKQYVEKHSQHRVVLSNKINYLRIYRYLKPEIILLPHTVSFLKDLSVEFSKHSDVFVLPTEGGYAEDETILEMVELDGDRDLNLKHVKRFYAWGEKIKEVLVRRGAYKEDQVKVTGNPRFDLYHSLKVGRENAQECGIATTLRLLTSIMQNPMVDRIAERSKLFEEDMLFWNQGGQLADTLWYESATVESMLHAVKELKAKKISCYLRPHPLESENAYRYFEKEFNVRVDKKQTLLEYFSQVFVLLTSCSTVTIDAFMSGVPVISLNGLFEKRRADLLIPKRLTGSSFNALSWMPKTFEELVEWVMKASQGKLAISPHQEKVEKFMLDFYHYYDGSSATALLGNDLISHLNSRKEENSIDPLAFMNHLLKEPLCHLFRYKSGDYYFSPYRLEDKKRLEFYKTKSKI